MDIETLYQTVWARVFSLSYVAFETADAEECARHASSNADDAARLAVEAWIKINRRVVVAKAAGQ